ncbi:GPI mannosyltransferase 1 [Atheta coriaria]|uniref:GPI mannosyltransferase 1 n=1 Tax=Dalotia coriaria TaxID=877792 RepID=UPI0031F342CD
MWRQVKNLNFYWHIVLAAILRAIFVCYGIYHDEHFTVSYTDIDYKVFTDAARHVLANESPYARHTYRYSPLMAIILTPNILLHHAFGKILFSLVDLLVAVLIRAIVLKVIAQHEVFKSTNTNNGQITEKGDGNNKTELNKPSLKSIRNRSRKSKHEKYDKKFIYKFKSDNEVQADVAAMLWLYNPLTIAIATRGSCDSMAGLFVLLSLYLLQCKKKYFSAGLVHGISVHFRLYPIIYSLAMFMYLSKYSYYTTNRFTYAKNQARLLQIQNQQNGNTNNGKKSKKELKNAENRMMQQKQDKTVAQFNEGPLIIDQRKTIFKLVYLMHLWPNLDQLRLVFGCLLSLGIVTGIFYYLYGYTFLFETYIYHLIRTDTRHNFSLFFYLQYLTAGVKNIGMWQKVLIGLPQLVLLLVFSVRYGLNKFSLNFSILTQTITMVTYNTVLTSQYFVWIMVVLPLSVWQIKMSLKMAAFFVLIWFAAQAAWLMPAYFLEFHGQNTFLFIWLQSVSFFCANVAILGRLIMNYMPARKEKVKNN